MLIIHNPNPNENHFGWKQFLCPKKEVRKYSEDSMDFIGDN